MANFQEIKKIIDKWALFIQIPILFYKIICLLLASNIFQQDMN